MCPRVYLDFSTGCCDGLIVIARMDLAFPEHYNGIVWYCCPSLRVRYLLFIFMGIQPPVGILSVAFVNRSCGWWVLDGV